MVNDKNLCVKAAKLFYEETALKNAVSLYLEKKIPFPAGLGGGSADAASVLLLLNSFYGNPLSEAKLFELAEKLGSDVPLCLYRKPALCEGRGEILTPIENLPDFDLVVAIGEGRLPTPEVYRKYDEMNLSVSNDTDKLIKAIENGNKSEIINSFGNTFESVADLMAPETKKLREIMLGLGAINSRLSGSGPSVYGVFDNREKSEEVAKKLKTIGYFAVACKTI